MSRPTQNVPVSLFEWEKPKMIVFEGEVPLSLTIVTQLQTPENPKNSSHDFHLPDPNLVFRKKPCGPKVSNLSNPDQRANS
jgi:hypothetical protein